MCGITGVFAYGRSGPALDEALLVRMAESMAHRGPDDAGVYLSSDLRVGFGFRRLAIIDLSPAGHQPMSNEDGTVWIVFNGEIYNHTELRQALEAKGHVYRGRSDTETIIHLYEEYGEECVHHLRGMFAFAIWDEPRRRLFLARDRLGIKPLYYCTHNGAFIFGSEIKALLAYPGVPRQLDDEALYHYLTFTIPPAPLTMFHGISKLPAGWRMTVREDGALKPGPYWQPVGPRAERMWSDEEYAERTRELVRESARMHVMSDVPVGVFLSGGLDSSTVVALMAERDGAPVNTFSVGFNNYERYNELGYARLVARHFNTNHHEVIIDHKDALDYIPKLVHSQDEPIADWVCVPLYFVSRLARDSGVIVVQVGEGADELFCGYPLYLASLAMQRWWPWLRVVPRSLWRLAGTSLGRIVDTDAGAGRKALRLMQRLQLEDGRFWGGMVVFGGADKAALLDVPFWHGRVPLDSAEVLDNFYRELEEMKPEAEYLEQMVYVELRQRLSELLLMRVDKITMSTSIEARVPYLDHKLVEFALSVPSAVSGLVPDTIIDRPKQGFNAPITEWLRNEMACEVRRSLLEGELVKRGYLNGEFVKRLVQTHQAARANHATELWTLYNLEMWHRHWIN